MGTTKQRKERLQHIRDMLTKAPNQKLGFSELYGPLVLEWGITKNTLENYLDALAAAGEVTHDFHPNYNPYAAGITFSVPITRKTWDKVYLVGGEGHRRRYYSSE